MMISAQAAGPASTLQRQVDAHFAEGFRSPVLVVAQPASVLHMWIWGVWIALAVNGRLSQATRHQRLRRRRHNRRTRSVLASLGRDLPCQKAAAHILRPSQQRNNAGGERGWVPELNAMGPSAVGPLITPILWHTFVPARAFGVAHRTTYLPLRAHRL